MILEELEVYLIVFLQKNFYSDKYNLFDHIAKLISSRKFRNLYLITFLIFLITKKDVNKILFLPKIFLLGILSRNFNIFIKTFIKRSRPYVKYSIIKTNPKTYDKKKNTYSLPSNSIQTSLIFYNILLKTILEIEGINLAIMLLIITLITSLAKIIRGLHYFSDILLSIIIFKVLDILYNFIELTFYNLLFIF